MVASTAAGGGPRFLALVGGLATDPPVPAVVRCRKRQQDEAPFEGLVYEVPQRYLLVGGAVKWPDRQGVQTGNYAGVDWASDKHDVLVANEAGEKLLAATFAHQEKWLQALCRTLVRMDMVLVAIERPDGPLVERLLDGGLRVLVLHPNKVAAARDRFRVSAVSRMGLTPSCCASWRARIIIVSACLSPTRMRRKRFGL